MAAGWCSVDASPVPLPAAPDLAALHDRVFHASRNRPRAGWVRRAEPGRVTTTALIVAVLSAAILLILSSSKTLGATGMTPRCDDINLRAGPSTNRAAVGQVDEGDRVTVVNTVDGGGYGVSCNDEFRSGSRWRKISAINGRSVESLYGVDHVFAAAKLFRNLSTTPAPPAPATPAPTPSRTAGPTSTPTATPFPESTAAATQEPVSTAAPTGNPTPTQEPVPSPTAPPTPTPTPTATQTPVPAPSFLPSPVQLGSSVTSYGRGWGHGVGLSQYGAQGRALDGQEAPEILEHYYEGTTLGTMSNRGVRVLVLEDFRTSPAEPVQIFGRGGDWSIDGVDATFP